MRNEQSGVSQVYHRRGSREAMGGLWAKLQAAGRFFCNFLGKTSSYFNAIGSQFARVYNHFKELDFEHEKAN